MVLIFWATLGQLKTDTVKKYPCAAVVTLKFRNKLADI